MAKIQTSCPNCKQPLVAEIFQVVDIKQEPRLKELLLAGGLNFVQCQLCGFQGQLPIPLVYHDGEKELLLTFSPPDSGKTMEEKESALAPLLKQVTDSLAPEERKGYLFQPQAMLTMNNLVKNVLLADGITEEMIQAQQEQMKLLETLFGSDGEQLKLTVQENQDRIDREFFALFAEIAQQIIASRDESSIEKIKQVQDVLMEETEIGRSIKTEAEEIRAATQALETLGNNLTRSSLLELIIQAPNQERVKAFAGLARPAMDYEFFSMFTERIEASEDDVRKEMVERRNLLLKVTEEIDQQMEERVTAVKKRLDGILESESIEQALQENIGILDQLFVQVVSSELVAAQENKDEKREVKIKELLDLIRRMTTPPELEIVEALLATSEEEEKFNQLVESLDGEILPKVIEYLTAIISNYDEQIAQGSSENLAEMEETQAQLKKIYNTLLKKSMELKFQE